MAGPADDARSGSRTAFDNRTWVGPDHAVLAESFEDHQDSQPSMPPRRDEDQRRVIDTLQVVELLLTGDSPSVVRAWFIGMNPQLDDERPVGEPQVHSHTAA